jgi:hypothetical protein
LALSAEAEVSAAATNPQEASRPASKTAINLGRATRGMGFLYDRPFIPVN